MFKKVLIGLLAACIIAIAVSQLPAAVCRTYPYCKLTPGSIDLIASVVTKYANKEDVAVDLMVEAPQYLPSQSDPNYIDPPLGWVDRLTLGQNDSKCVCRNPGTNGWTAPGQNPPPTTALYSGVSILYYVPKNGKTIAYVNGEMEQPYNITDYCPNSNWFLDCVPEYFDHADIREIIIEAPNVCKLVSTATYYNCYVDLNNVVWDPEKMLFTGPEYQCVGETVLTEDRTPQPIVCPLELGQ